MTSLERPGDLPHFVRWLALAALAGAMVFGADAMAFLCDDAFIHFRYAANAHDGHGLVWNAAPWKPVEGYGFLWVMILWGVWEVFGVEPPDAANPLSILFGGVQLLLLAAAARRLVSPDGARLPAIVGLAGLVAIVGSRTFLQWLSGGLDTALFNMWLFGWVLWAFRTEAARPGARWFLVWSAFAALAALTRPDGLPLVAATVGVGLWQAVGKRCNWRTIATGLLPLLAVAAHVVWRRCYYGEWLPNTYYAKVVAAWPEAGLRYFACFALENGAWLWFPIATVWGFVEWRRFGLPGIVKALLQNVAAVAVVVVVVFNASYYLFKVGGDHFEYRVLSQTVPLGVLACVAMVARMGRSLWLPIATAGTFLLAGSVGFWHYAVTSDANPLRNGARPLTPQVPGFLKPLARWFDHQQLWLFVRYVGLRVQHHQTVLSIYMQNAARSRGPVAAPGTFPVLATGAVGLPSWLYTDCAIIDEYGLNDWVIARTPASMNAPVPVGRLHEVAAQADADGDGWFTLVELRQACASAFRTGAGDAGGDFLLQFLIEVYADAKPDAVAAEHVPAILALLDAPRRMAHDRIPPPGYVSAFDANVGLDGSVRARAVPLTADRIRAIEAEWERKVRAGEFR